MAANTVGMIVRTLLILFLSLTCAKAGGPLHDQKRVVSGQTVDLKPLFTWWTNHHGDRPLTAWVHLTGSIAGTNAVGWIISGVVDHPHRAGDDSGDADGSSSKLILSTPPWAELVDFERLAAQLRGLQSQRAQVASAEKQAAGNVKNLHSSHIAPRVRAAEERQWQAAEKADKNQLQALDAKIQETKHQLAVYPNADHYAIDCFALETGKKFTGMSVYDHGQVFKP